MKLVFVNEAEKRRISDIVNDASSISNSQSLIGLVKDAVVDGSEPEPVEVVKKKPEEDYKTLPVLIEKARGMGIVMDFANASRAGVLKAIEDAKKEPAPEPEKVEESSIATDEEVVEEDEEVL